MSQFDFKLMFVRARELQAHLAKDHSGEHMRQLVRYFSDAEEAAQQLVTEGESAESMEILTAMITAFARCRLIVESVWQGFHPQANHYTLEAR